MSSVNEVSQNIQSLGINQNANANKGELGQADFLELMIAQMNFQNPLEPQSNGEFIAQMAQFGTVEGIQKLQDSFSGFTDSMASSQAIGATSLVGRTVLASSNTATLETDKSITGAINLTEAATNVQLGVYNAQGELVKHLSLGDHNQGNVNFEWDGKDDSGEQAPTGTYTVKAMGLSSGQSKTYSTQIATSIDSVVIDPTTKAVKLNISGMGLVPMSDITHIK